MCVSRWALFELQEQDTAERGCQCRPHKRSRSSSVSPEANETKLKSAGDTVNQVAFNTCPGQCRSPVCESVVQIEYGVRSGMADRKPVPVAVGKQSRNGRKQEKFEKLYIVKGVECNERSRGEVVWRRKMRDKMGWSGGKVRVERVFRCERKADNEGRSSKRVSSQVYKRTVMFDGYADMRATGG